jgi:hypothetical protein
MHRADRFSRSGRLPCPRKQAKMSTGLHIDIIIEESGVFAFDLDGSELDGPIVGLMHLQAEAPIIQSQINPKFQFSDDHTQNGQVLWPMSAHARTRNARTASEWPCRRDHRQADECFWGLIRENLDSDRGSAEAHRNPYRRCLRSTQHREAECIDFLDQAHILCHHSGISGNG